MVFDIIIPNQHICRLLLKKFKIVFINKSTATISSKRRFAESPNSYTLTSNKQTKGLFSVAGIRDIKLRLIPRIEDNLTNKIPQANQESSF